MESCDEQVLGGKSGSRRARLLGGRFNQSLGMRRVGQLVSGFPTSTAPADAGLQPLFELGDIEPQSLQDLGNVPVTMEEP
jgi:hypothetical protein